MSKCVRFNIIMMKSMLGNVICVVLVEQKPKVYLYVFSFFLCFYIIFCYCSIFKTLSRISFPMSLYIYVCIWNKLQPSQ